MRADEAKKVKLAVVGGIALIAIAFAIYMVMPAAEKKPTAADIEAAQKAQEMVKAAEEAAKQGNNKPAPPPPPAKPRGGMVPSGS